MLITLDTNVLVSAFVSKAGHPALVLDVALTFERLELVLSKEILDELAEVLSRREATVRFGYSKRQIKQFASALRRVAKIVEIKSNFKVVKQDPDDDKILNTAMDGRADYIVSGDQHLLALRRFRGIRIVSPRQMLEIIRSRFGEVIVPREHF